jgi:hypothetical protein
MKKRSQFAAPKIDVSISWLGRYDKRRRISALGNKANLPKAKFP